LSDWIARARSIGQSAPAAVALLVLANLVPLAGVLWFGWDVGMVLITYWLENGIVGLINVPKILLARDSSTELAKHPRGGWVYAAFFLVHYGIFWMVHGTFVFLIVGRGPLIEVTDPLRAVVSDQALVLAALVLFASHGASFLVNYLGRGEYLRASPDTQMLQPYARMFVLHITIVLGGVFVISQGQPIFAVVLLVVSKTLLDLILHLREHGRGASDHGTAGPKGMETTRAG
jgi:hypothetical protein